MGVGGLKTNITNVVVLQKILAPRNKKTWQPLYDTSLRYPAAISAHSTEHHTHTI